MKGFKASVDGKCLGFLYEVGKTYEKEEDPVICSRGFHFCHTIANTINYYPFSKDNVYFEVEALGKIERKLDKIVTNKIKILRRVDITHDGSVSIENDSYRINTKESREIFRSIKNNQVHRISGPAITESNGDQYWYINGKLHRENGPVVVTSWGKEFWRKGKRLFSPTPSDPNQLFLDFPNFSENF